MEKPILAVFGIVGALVVFAIIFTVPVYFLWNWLMPELFGLKSISFWQATGLLLLSGFFFRSSSHSSK